MYQHVIMYLYMYAYCTSFLSNYRASRTTTRRTRNQETTDEINGVLGLSCYHYTSTIIGLSSVHLNFGEVPSVETIYKR